MFLVKSLVGDSDLESQKVVHGDNQSVRDWNPKLRVESLFTNSEVSAKPIHSVTGRRDSLIFLHSALVKLIVQARGGKLKFEVREQDHAIFVGNAFAERVRQVETSRTCGLSQSPLCQTSSR